MKDETLNQSKTSQAKPCRAEPSQNKRAYNFLAYLLSSLVLIPIFAKKCLSLFYSRIICKYEHRAQNANGKSKIIYCDRLQFYLLIPGKMNQMLNSIQILCLFGFRRMK